MLPQDDVGRKSLTVGAVKVFMIILIRMEMTEFRLTFFFENELQISKELFSQFCSLAYPTTGLMLTV